MTADELAKAFVEQYPAISSDETVLSALSKMFKTLKQSLTSQEAVQLYISNGSGIISVNDFYAKLDGVEDLAEDEKLLMAFLPVDKVTLNL